jgi:hypothetical protein
VLVQTSIVQEVSAALGVVAQACTLICLGAERNTGQARSGGLNDRLYFVNWQRATGSLYSTVVVRVTRNDKVECSIHSRGSRFCFLELVFFWYPVLRCTSTGDAIRAALLSLYHGAAAKRKSKLFP